MRSTSIFNSVGHEEAGPIDVALQPNEPIRSAISLALRDALLALSWLDGPKKSPEISNRTKRRKSALVALRGVIVGADAPCTGSDRHRCSDFPSMCVVFDKSGTTMPAPTEVTNKQTAYSAKVSAPNVGALTGFNHASSP